MKIDILAFGAHPDDVELSCGGTLYNEIQNGKSVGIIDLSAGELGTRGNAKIRSKESALAATILGVSFRKNLGLPDGFIFNTKENQMKVINLIRHYQPDVVLCNAVNDRHPDHARAIQLVSDACFSSGLVKIVTHFDGVEQQVWRPQHVYHYIQWKSLQPDFVVDISEAIEIKLQAVMAYKSQFFDPNSQEPETLISSKNFSESIRYRASDLGRLTGVAYAEGFTTERLVVVDSLFDLK